MERSKMNSKRVSRLFISPSAPLAASFSSPFLRLYPCYDSRLAQKSKSLSRISALTHPIKEQTSATGQVDFCERKLYEWRGLARIVRKKDVVDDVICGFLTCSPWRRRDHVNTKIEGPRWDGECMGEGGSNSWTSQSSCYSLLHLQLLCAVNTAHSTMNLLPALIPHTQGAPDPLGQRSSWSLTDACSYLPNTNFDNLAWTRVHIGG